MSFDVVPEGDREAAEFTGRERRNIDITLQSEFEMLLDTIVADARSNVQNNLSIVTGDLNASIQVLRIGALEGEVGTELEYAEFVEYGRGPVVATDKPLHWIDKETGEDRFAWSVGPAEPQPFMEPAVIINTEQFPRVAVMRLESENG
jgi:hypothetical protein